MLLRFTILSILTICCTAGPSGLTKGPDPLNEEKASAPKKVARRQYTASWIQPSYQPYVPFVLPTYEVHHIIILQAPPSARCFPDQGPVSGRVPSGTLGPTTVPTVDDRFGPEDRNQTTPPTVAQPSRCVWAIVACCSPGSANIRYSCFELLGCPGAFWDKSPCDQRVVQAAANTALKFYMDGGTKPTDEPVSNIL